MAVVKFQYAEERMSIIAAWRREGATLDAGHKNGVPGKRRAAAGCSRTRHKPLFKEGFWSG